MGTCITVRAARNSADISCLASIIDCWDKLIQSRFPNAWFKSPLALDKDVAIAMFRCAFFIFACFFNCVRAERGASHGVAGVRADTCLARGESPFC